MVQGTLDDAMAEETCSIMVVRFLDVNRRLILIVCQTPNRILSTEDIPDRLERSLSPDVSYPEGVRFTQHSFEISRDNISNVDASFRSPQNLNLPSMLLLQYHYARCAMRRWGRNTEVVESDKLHRVKVPSSTPMGLSPIGRHPKRIRGRGQTVISRENGQGVPSKSRRAPFQESNKDEEEPKQERSMEAIVLALSSASDAAYAARVEREKEASEFSSSKRMGTISWVESLRPPEPL